MRAALDHAAVATVVQNGGNPKGVYFPFAESADKLADQIKDKKFNRASTEAQKLMEGLKPYRGGNAALRAIHDLDTRDKHSALIELATMARQGHRLVIGGVNMAGNQIQFKEGAGLVIHDGSDAPIRRPMPIGFIPSIAHDQPLGGSELLPTLASLAELVDGIIKAFSALERRESP